MAKHLNEFTVEELKKKAAAKKIPGAYKMRKAELVNELRKINAKIAAGYKRAAAKK
jgi:hypothetical protein